MFQNCEKKSYHIRSNERTVRLTFQTNSKLG